MQLPRSVQLRHQQAWYAEFVGSRAVDRILNRPGCKKRVGLLPCEKSGQLRNNAGEVAHAADIVGNGCLG